MPFDFAPGMPAVLPEKGATSVVVHSVLVIEGTQKQVLAGTCTETRGAHDTANGCAFEARKTGTVPKTTFDLYSGLDAKGCLVAQGTYQGKVVAHKDIPIKFRWTGRC
jgi:hypothetical protein